MKTKNLMSSPAVTVHPHDRLAHAAAPDRDVCMAAWSTGKPLHELRVQDAMSKALVSVRADDDLGVAVDRMTMHQLHRLPVVDEHERPVGVLSLNDLGRRGDKDPQLGKRALQVMAAVCRLRNEAAPPAQRTMQAAAQAVAT